jgi:predicted nucleotidyltransferase
MEIISKISKGSKMDQIYIPKNREGLEVGSIVVIKPLIEQKPKTKLYSYNTKSIEPIKIKIINEIMSNITKSIECENIIITGSFLNQGFKFNDIDILIITDKKLNASKIKENLERKLQIKTDLLILDNKSLQQGLNTDPLYSNMLSKCISKNRIIYKKQREINYKLLDLHLLKSNLILTNFDNLTGNEKYNLTRNMVSILLFIDQKKLSNEKINEKITQLLKISINEIKENLLDKKEFLTKYKQIYNNLYKRILNNGAK